MKYEILTLTTNSQLKLTTQLLVKWHCKGGASLSNKGSFINCASIPSTSLGEKLNNNCVLYCTYMYSGTVQCTYT